MKEYAFTKWLVPTLQADGTEQDMVYNEQMGIFTVRGENQFQKGSIDTQHTVSLLVLKGEISIQTNDKLTVISAPSYIEFIEPHQWSDLKTDRDFEGYLLITRREIFFAGSRMHPFQGRSLCIQTRTGTVYSFGETGSSPDTITYRHVAPHPSAKRESFPGGNAGKHASFPHPGSVEHYPPHVQTRKRVRALFPLERYPPSFSIPDAYQLPLSPHRKMVCRPTLRIPRCVIGQVKEALWKDSQPAHQRKPDRRSESLSAQSG